MHIMSILCSVADVVSSGSCPILFQVLTLNVPCLHFSNFCCLSSVADFSNTAAVLQPQQDFFLPAQRAMWFKCGSWLSFSGSFVFLFSSIEATLIDE